jgi:hypothetical protein
MRTPQAAGLRTANRFVTRAGGGILRQMPPGARARVMLAKRQLKRRGFGDDEAALLAIENFADDFGRRRISIKRGFYQWQAVPLILLHQV